MGLAEDFNLNPPHPRTPWWRDWKPIDVVRSASLVLILIAAFLIYGQAKQTHDAVLDGKERGFINRATICQLQVEQGAELSPGCSDPNVLKYYDPHAPLAKQNQTLICELAAALQVKLASCDSS